MAPKGIYILILRTYEYMLLYMAKKKKSPYVIKDLAMKRLSCIMSNIILKRGNMVWFGEKDMTREVDTRKRKGFENIMYYVAIFKRQDEEDRQEIQVACEAGKGLKKKKKTLL